MLKYLRRFVRQHPNIATLLTLFALFGLAQITLGTRPTPVTSAEELDIRLADGQPTLIEFYSNL